MKRAAWRKADLRGPPGAMSAAAVRFPREEQEVTLRKRRVWRKLISLVLRLCVGMLPMTALAALPDRDTDSGKKVGTIWRRSGLRYVMI